MSEPTDTSSPDPRPRGSTPPSPSWGCFRLEQRQGPGCIAWYLVDLEECHPSTTADPSESQQTTCHRSSLLSYSLPNKQRVPAALPGRPAGSPNMLSPLPDLSPTLPWAYSHALLHPVAKVLLEPCNPAVSLFSCWAEGPRAPPSTSLMRSLRTEDTAKASAIVLSFVLGHAVCLSGSITIL